MNFHKIEESFLYLDVFGPTYCLLDKQTNSRKAVTVLTVELKRQSKEEEMLGAPCLLLHSQMLIPQKQQFLNYDNSLIED